MHLTETRRLKQHENLYIKDTQLTLVENEANLEIEIQVRNQI